MASDDLIAQETYECMCCRRDYEDSPTATSCACCPVCLPLLEEISTWLIERSKA